MGLPQHTTPSTGEHVCPCCNFERFCVAAAIIKGFLHWSVYAQVKQDVREAEDKLFKLKMLSDLAVCDTMLRNACALVPDPAFYAVDEDGIVVLTNGSPPHFGPVTTRFEVRQEHFDAISYAFRRFDMSIPVLVRLFWVAVMVRENDWDAGEFAWQACAEGNFVHALGLVSM